jgi:hypothetical protein
MLGSEMSLPLYPGIQGLLEILINHDFRVINHPGLVLSGQPLLPVAESAQQGFFVCLSHLAQSHQVRVRLPQLVVSLFQLVSYLMVPQVSVVLVQPVNDRELAMQWVSYTKGQIDSLGPRHFFFVQTAEAQGEGQV